MLVTPEENSLIKEGKTQRYKGNSVYTIEKSFCTLSFYPYIGKGNQTYQIESKTRV